MPLAYRIFRLNLDLPRIYHYLWLVMVSAVGSQTQKLGTRRACTMVRISASPEKRVAVSETRVGMPATGLIPAYRLNNLGNALKRALQEVIVMFFKKSNYYRRLRLISETLCFSGERAWSERILLGKGTCLSRSGEFKTSKRPIKVSGATSLIKGGFGVSVVGSGLQ